MTLDEAAKADVIQILRDIRDSMFSLVAILQLVVQKEYEKGDEG